MKLEEIGEAFERYFRLVPATDEVLREEVYRIRYEVYCAELGYEDPDRFANRMETDEFDRHAHHCLLMHLPSNSFAGCVRLVLPDQGNEQTDPRLPFERVCASHPGSAKLDQIAGERATFGEISRLAVTAQFRKREGERSTATGMVAPAPNSMDREQRRFPMIAPGLYLAAAAIAMDQGLDSVFVMMEPRLGRHLRRFGINFRQVGEVIDYHGKRGPFRITRDDLLNGLSPPLRYLLDVIRHQLADHTDIADGLRKA